MQTTFVQISDLHFGQESVKALGRAAEVIATLRPDAVIVSGDLTALGARREMRAACNWLRTLAAPVIVTPGNHDTPYFDLLPRLIGPFHRFQKESHGLTTKAWPDPRFVIVPINTARGVQWRKNWALGAISSSQTKQACQVLTAAPEGALKVVVTHHPLVWPRNSAIAGDTRGGAKAFDQLCAAGADLFLSGHLHQTAIECVEKAGRQIYLASAGTLSIRHRGEPSSFLVIHRSEDGAISFERISVPEDAAMQKIDKKVIKPLTLA